MSFRDSIAALPFAATTPTGRGFLPPILRGSNHVLFLTACLADEHVTVNEEEALTELRHAQEHWNARTITENVSDAASQRASTIGVAIGEAITEYHGWTEEQRINNLRDLAHRVVAFSAELDRELVGLTGSDAGTSL